MERITLTIAVRFPLGRYHATPWNASANEALPEWPPSPWRIIRGLVAVWMTRVPELQKRDVMDLLNRLVAEPPMYWLPRSVIGHTRHYMPTSKHRTNTPGKNRSLAFDAFLSIDPTEELLVEFLYSSRAGDHEIISALLQSLPYLGRADSVCHARLITSSTVDKERLIRCVPGPSGRDRIRLLVPAPPFSFQDLCESPTALRKTRRLDPMKARWVDYKMVDRPTQKRALSTSKPLNRITTARWYLPDAGRPHVAETVALGHLLRQAVMKRTRNPSSALSGHDDSGPRTDQHQHAHYLALSSNRDGRIDTLVLWAPGGLGEREIAGIGSLRHLSAPEFLRRLGTYRLGLEVLASDDLAIPELVSTTGSPTEWVSETPYIPGRAFRNWADPDSRKQHLEDDVKRELQYRRLPLPMRIEQTQQPLGATDWRRYRRTRPGQRGRGWPGTWLRLRFAEPVRGPLALGRLSHFGLGLFKPFAGIRG